MSISRTQYFDCYWHLVLGRSREISEYFNKREDSRGVGLDPSNVQRENLELRTL